ncbi:tyrosine-protein kinase family protein [Olsenella profusa]|uniref:non-specific protein-tyrosine kinase n=1 Tax=Olsenella profusa TaxID=138595 RepID=A0ABS2F1R9_9ACTN|nr:CpsD/CapB family tyrosine-protein kinase [Olsenella profusa]MBM6774929.1 CpsD/CapB family tyrosine-protein kinase [Olsenella profusa]
MPGKKKGSSRVAVQNAAKTLAANIRFASVDNPVSSIVVTSSVPNEGKSFVSVELARALAASGKRVLLIECDMRKRSLAAMLDVHGRHGIYAVLSGEADLDESVVPTKTQGLFFLDAEPGIPNPTDILSSKRFRGLLQGVRKSFGYVVMDTPPVGAFVDAAVLGSVADATVLVVRENFVRRDELVAAYTQLRQADVNLVGAVLNCCDNESAGYGYYSHYGSEPSRSAAEDQISRATAQAAPTRQQAQAASGLRPIPQPQQHAVSPDSTAQFIAGYQPRTRTDD